MMNLDFITSLWPGAQRAPASLPSVPPFETDLDDRWKVASNSPAKKRKTSGKRPTRVRQAPSAVDGDDAVILALLAECRARGQWRLLSVTELANAMRCSVGESSKRIRQVAEVEGEVWAQRSGRSKMVGLHRVSSEAWEQIVSSTPERAVALYRLAIHPQARASARNYQ